MTHIGALINPLIIGSTGCLGTSLVQVLRRMGISVEKSFEKSFKDNFRRGLSPVIDIDFLESFKFTSIMYLSQSRKYKDYPSGIPELNLINNILPLKFADISASLNIPFVYCSTGSVYGSTNDVLSERSKLLEDVNMTSYIASKLFADQTLIERMKEQEILILRPFFIYGEGAKIPALFPSLINEISLNKVINLKGIDGLLFNPVSSLDASRAICHLLTNGISGVFNLSGIETVSLRNVSNIIADQLKTVANFSQVEGEQKIISDQSKLLDTGFSYVADFKISFTSYIKQFSTP